MADEPVTKENVDLNNFKTQLLQLKPGESLTIFNQGINLYISTGINVISGNTGLSFTKVSNYTNALFWNKPNTSNLGSPIKFSSSYEYDLGMHYYLKIVYINGMPTFNHPCVTDGSSVTWGNMDFTNNPSLAVKSSWSVGYVSSFLTGTVAGTACVINFPVKIEIEYNPYKATISSDKFKQTSLTFSLGGAFDYNSDIQQTPIMLSPTYFELTMPDIHRSCNFITSQPTVDFGQLDVSKLDSITAGSSFLSKDFSIGISCTDDNYTHYNDSVGIVVDKAANPTLNNDATISTYISGKKTGVAIKLKLNGTSINTLCDGSPSCTLYGEKEVTSRVMSLNYAMTAVMQKNNSCGASCISDYKSYIGSNITGVVNLKVMLQ
ncbi:MULTISPECIES: fimbrial protein [Cysteiniphilum]|nr:MULTISPECIES: fimbrial protein [Cysteiniphilum]